MIVCKNIMISYLSYGTRSNVNYGLTDLTSSVRSQLLYRYGAIVSSGICRVERLRWLPVRCFICIEYGRKIRGKFYVVQYIFIIDQYFPGNLHEGAKILARAVLISHHTEQHLSSLEQTLPPAQFALVRKKMTHYEQECNMVSNDALKLPEELKNVNVVPMQSDSNETMNMKRKKIEKPESISQDEWRIFYDLGRHVSGFVLDALAVYESGDFASWGKNLVKNI
ncbi:hypothetical protein PMAYCL1PPCAC_25154, partial [Pristionchus mayeri]